MARALGALIRATCIAAAATVASPAAQAGSYRSFDVCRSDFQTSYFIRVLCLQTILWVWPKGDRPDMNAWGAPPQRRGPSASSYILSNLGAGLSKNEPTFGGRMKNSVWAQMKPDRASRVVLHTFGSDIDTVLAVYDVEVNKRGKASYTLLRGNDDTPVPGVGRGWSLVTVDVKKGETYEVQIGGEDGAQSNRVSLSARAFAPKGGVSAFLLSTTTGATMQNRDYVCEQRPCPAPTFILHNSAKSPVKVTPASTLPDQFADPAPVTIGPNKLAVVTFASKDFSSAGGVSKSGAFTFGASVGGDPIESAEKNATVFLSDPSGSPLGLESSVEDRLKVGFVNQPHSFEVTLRNTGSDVARGCAFRTFQSNVSNVFTRYRTVDGAGKPTGDWGEAADIPAGGSQNFEVEVSSMEPRLGDPEFGLGGEVQDGCVNRQGPAIDLLNTVDVNADGTEVYTEIDARLVGPKTLDVPPGGQASFDVVAKNRLRGVELVARPVYVRPFDQSDADKQYGLSACRLDRRGKCATPKTFDAPWRPKRGDEARFRVFVKAPKTKPPSDPGRFRIYLKFVGEQDEWPNLFGAESVAVRVK